MAGKSNLIEALRLFPWIGQGNALGDFTHRYGVRGKPVEQWGICSSRAADFLPGLPHKPMTLGMSTASPLGSGRANSPLPAKG